MVNPSQSKTVRDYSPTIAKLLATENIRIEHGNFESAFFDLENRVLGLPMWTNMSKSTYDMMVGHEVGHALYTPASAWLTSLDDCPKLYLNIVEDIRIERLVQSTYPGLMRQFRVGYADLQQRDMFGLKGRDPQTLGIADRVNLRAKLGDNIAVTFSSAEQPVVDACFSASTWEDVVKAAKALSALDRAPEPQPQPEQGESSEEDTAQSPSDEAAPQMDNQSDNAQNDEGSSKSSEASKDQETNESKQNSKPESAQQDSTKQSSSDKNSPSAQPSSKPSQSKPDSQTSTSAGNDEPAPETQENFDKALSQMIDRSPITRNTMFLSELTRKECLEVVTDYKKLFAERDRSHAYKQIKESYLGSESNTKDAVSFVKDTKKFASILRKQFELRKAAYQYVRSKESRTGELDMGKLHNYKTADDIFLSVTSLADAKSHGMVMFIDYSDSMRPTITYIIKHVVNLVYFCKMTGIPFEVYGFTSASHGYNECKYRGINVMDLRSTQVFELISSGMSKTEFNRAMSDLVMVITGGRCELSRFESMAGTPLHETITVAHHIINRFKERYRRQKNVAIVLTDGEPNPTSVYMGPADSIRNSHSGKTPNEFYSENRTLPTRAEIPLCGKTVKTNGSMQLLPELLKNLGQTTGCTVLGFFIPSGTASIRRALDYDFGGKEGLKEIVKTINRDKVAVFPNRNGYDKYFIVSSGSDLDVDADEFEVKPNMSKSSIVTAFKKFSASKKSNRVFVTQFANAIS